MKFPKMRSVAPRALKIVRSAKFFYATVILLIIQGIWVALTARYPMAFDENYHFGVIQIYAHQWSPFITSAPPDSAVYGELIRVTSYLYHYLMSFPYRLIELFTHDQTLQVILLRFINIALFTGGLVAFRRLLQKIGFSSGITNLSLFVLVLIPVVPFLAGQINYDNLVFLIVPLTGIFVLSCSETLQTKGYIPARNFIALLSIGMLGSLVKYAYAPIFLAALLYLAYRLFRQKHYSEVFTKTWRQFKKVLSPLAYMLIALFVVSTALFAERYGVNIITYGQIEPDCASIQSVEDCQQYGPWGRNYLIEQDNEVKGNSGMPNIFAFVPEWIGGMMHRLYFAINYDYVNYPELPLPILTGYVVGGIGLALAFVYGRTLMKNPRFLIALLFTVLYIGALVYINFRDYLHYKEMLAINGRYLIIVLPFMFAIIGTAYTLFIQKFTTMRHTFLRSPAVKLTLASLAVVLMLQGGGILTFAVRSDSSWYWENQIGQNLGHGLKSIATPFIFGAHDRGKAA